MILLDTHTWFWWVATPELLPDNHRKLLDQIGDTLAVSMISLWGVALLQSKKRIELPKPIAEWFELATVGSGTNVIDITREVTIEANNLPGVFHKDPADRMIVATSRILNSPILTSDDKILKYSFVEKAL